MQVCTHTHARKTIITSFTCCKPFTLSKLMSFTGINNKKSLYTTKGHWGVATAC